MNLKVLLSGACAIFLLTVVAVRWPHVWPLRVSRSLTFLPAAPFANGSFESGGWRWVVDGNQTIMPADRKHPASSGSNLVVFNLDDQPSSGARLSQTFGTVPGQRYGLGFHLGTTGAVGDQVMQVTVEGRRVLLDEVVSVAGLDKTPFYVPHYLTFTADSRRATLTFTDQSYTYVVIDELLDNVRITPEAAGAPVIASPPLRTAVEQGHDASFRVTTSGQGPFTYQWHYNNQGIPGATNSSYTVRSADFSQSGNYSVTVTNGSGSTTSSAATLTVLPPAIVLNGSFEYGTAGWTFTRPDVAGASISTNPEYGVTDGTQLVHFNWGQHIPDGTVSQRFATIPNRRYRLSFDVGAFSMVNRNEQRMRVAVQGATERLSREFVVFAPGTGGRYRPETLTFVADSASTTVRFEDTSRTTDSIDLLLDNVRVTDDETPARHTAEMTRERE